MGCHYAYISMYICIYLYIAYEITRSHSRIRSANFTRVNCRKSRTDRIPGRHLGANVVVQKKKHFQSNRYSAQTSLTITINKCLENDICSKHILYDDFLNYFPDKYIRIFAMLYRVLITSREIAYNTITKHNRFRQKYTIRLVAKHISVKINYLFYFFVNTYPMNCLQRIRPNYIFWWHRRLKF